MNKEKSKIKNQKSKIKHFFYCFLALLGLLFLVLGLRPGVAMAATYDPYNVIPNDVFINKTSMSAAQIESFLVTKGGFYKNYTIPEYVSTPFPYRDASGNPRWATVNVRQVNIGNGLTGQLWGKKVSQLIYEECQAHGINPQLVLVMLQKESSIVTQSNPDSVTRAWPMFYGFNESMASFKYTYDQARNQTLAYGGVGQQLARSIWWLKIYYDDAPTKSLGWTPTCDGQVMTAANYASQVLYLYTPHSQYNVWKIMQDWFAGGFAYYPFGPVPNSKLGKVGTDYYLIYDGKYYNLGTTELAVQNYGHSTTTVHVTSLENLVNGGSLSNYIQAPNGTQYLVFGGLRYSIWPSSIFKARWGLTSRQPTSVLTAFVNNIPNAPRGLSGLVRSSSTSTALYLVDASKRYAVWPTTAFLTRFDMRWEDAVVLPTATINSLPSAGKLTALIRGKTKGMVYLVDGGYGKPIMSMGIFYHWGWQTRDITYLSDNFINNYRKKSFVTRLMWGGSNVYWVNNGSYYRLGTSGVMDSRGWSWGDVGALSAGFASQLPIAGVIWK